MTLNRLLLIGLVLFASQLYSEQPTPAAMIPTPPTGIYVCRGPGATPDNEINFPFVTGWLVRFNWDRVEPKDGQYDWNYIDREFATARRLKKKITLAITGGPQTPEWVYQAGAKKFEFVMPKRPGQRGGLAQIPILWDEIYLAKWSALIRNFGKHFHREKDLALVHVTGATQNGFEMNLPFGPQDAKNWKAVEFTPEKATNAWKQILDVYAEAFPRTPLDIDVHPVIGLDKIAQDVAAYGFEKWNKRFGLYAAWLNGKSPLEDRYHRGMVALLQNFSHEGFLTFQLVGSETHQADRFSSGGMENAVRQGMAWGGRYFEVWHEDAMNPKFDAVLRKIAADLDGTKIKREVASVPVPSTEQPATVPPGTTNNVNPITP